ncbi:hypothetical protein [Rhodopila sp.]|uniref:hypothetical protein n=1 Tax=Rhodopila sp. TaxID=2480087 RepID=UPI003D0C5579
MDELSKRKRIARQMGSQEHVARQRAGGRLTVRKRMEQCLDRGSFQELGSIAGTATYDKTGRVIIEYVPANGVFGR